MFRGAALASALALALAAVLAPACVAQAQEARVDAVETPRMFREAVLGYCAERVHGAAIVPHQIDATSADWIDLQSDAVVTGGQRIFAGRLNRATGIIIDVSPSGGSCFVQINLATSVLPVMDGLRAEVRALPNVVLLEEVTTTEGHGTIFGVIDPDRDSVPIFAINDGGADGSAGTAILAMGSKGS